MKNIFPSLLLIVLLINFTGCKNQDNPYGIQEVVAVTEVFGEGQKVSAVILEFGADIKNDMLTVDDFLVEGRTITKLYANNVPEKSGHGVDGRYIIIELSPKDTGAATYLQKGEGYSLVEANISVRQLNTIETVAGKPISAFSGMINNDRQMNLVVDDFIQCEYKDTVAGISLPYNLFIPAHYDEDHSYPLVMFIHDAGSSSSEIKTTLVQGLGAVVWATPYEQAKHPALVLAPQYPGPILGTDPEACEYLDVTMNLLHELTGQYNIDTTRLYVTGQSGGGLMSLAMNSKYPDIFAASFLVAGQWDTTQVSPLVDSKLWIVVSEGDANAFPDMTSVTDTLENLGARVDRAVWDGRSTKVEFAADANRMINEPGHIKYVLFRKGTIVPVGMKDDSENNHMFTWRIAYKIEGIRDWLFMQRKEEKETLDF